MSKGTPDYYRTVREIRGAAKALEGGETAVANSEKDLGSVSGKGVIYGGVIYAVEAASQKNSQARLYIDDVMITQSSFQTLKEKNLTIEHSYPLYLRQFDEVNYQYSVGVSGNITFETSFKITYREEHGATPSVGFEVIYALL